MARLTADQVRGIWAGVTMSWDEDCRFDEECYALTQGPQRASKEYKDEPLVVDANDCAV